MSKRIDLTGHRYGRLLVKGFAYRKDGRIFWDVVCDCGSERVYHTAVLRHHTRSCGCLKTEVLIKRNRNRKQHHPGRNRPNFRKPDLSVTTFIYALTEPDTGEIRYIGKSVGSKMRRYTAHIKNADTGNRRFYSANWIMGLLQNGKKPGIVFLEECKGDGSAEEKFHIRLARQDGLRLTNSTEGGEGCVGFKHSDESKKRMSADRKGKKRDPKSVALSADKRRGQKLSAEVCKRMSEAGRRRVFTEEAKEQARRIGREAAITRIGKKNSPETIEKMRAAKLEYWRKRRESRASST